MIKVILAPDYDKARTYAEQHRVDATVEAEYGAKCVEGETITLAHHGPRADNPAPCNDPHATQLKDDSTILVSHLDLDALGGCMALMGTKSKDVDFWKAAEKMDVEGYHHISELTPKLQDQLNAFYATEGNMPRYQDVTDITSEVQAKAEIVSAILDEKHPNHSQLIEAGRVWASNLQAEAEKCLVTENENGRAFLSNGADCSAAYYSPRQQKICPAIVIYNKKYNSITVGFYDGGSPECSAREIVQDLWGPEAGGRDGIAGSPRNWDKSPSEMEQEFFRAQRAVNERVQFMKDADAVERRLTVNLDDFEPTDSQGYSMDGVVRYRNREFFVSIGMEGIGSYEHQAAMQVVQQLNEEHKKDRIEQMQQEMQGLVDDLDRGVANDDPKFGE